MKALKTIGIVLLMLLLIAVVKYAVQQTIKSTAPAKEDSYLGITREEYLNRVSNNGQDTAARCVYANLIDKYGIKETYNIDYRASKDENDVDQRLYEELERCM